MNRVWIPSFTNQPKPCSLIDWLNLPKQRFIWSPYRRRPNAGQCWWGLWSLLCRKSLELVSTVSRSLRFMNAEWSEYRVNSWVYIGTQRLKVEWHRYRPSKSRLVERPVSPFQGEPIKEMDPLQNWPSHPLRIQPWRFPLQSSKTDAPRIKRSLFAAWARFTRPFGLMICYTAVKVFKFFKENERWVFGLKKPGISSDRQ